MYLTKQLQDGQKWIEVKVQINKSIITVGDYNTPFSITDRISRQNIIKNIKDMTTTKNLI